MEGKAVKGLVTDLKGLKHESLGRTIQKSWWSEVSWLENLLKEEKVAFPQNRIPKKKLIQNSFELMTWGMSD
jgi:hypothetical protein